MSRIIQNLKELEGKTIKSITHDDYNGTGIIDRITIQTTDNQDYEIETIQCIETDTALQFSKLTKLTNEVSTLTPDDAIYNTLESDFFWEDKDSDVKDHMNLSAILEEIKTFAWKNELDVNTNSDWITIQNKASKLLEHLYNECLWNVWGTHQKDKSFNIVITLFKRMFNVQLDAPDANHVNDYVYDWLVDFRSPLGWSENDVLLAIIDYIKNEKK